MAGLQHEVALLLPARALALGLILIFPIRDLDQIPDAADETRPPYWMHPELVRELLEPRFAATELRPVSESHPGREGMEWLGRWKKRG